MASKRLASPLLYPEEMLLKKVFIPSQRKTTGPYAMALLPFLPLHISCGFSFASDWLYHNAGIAMDEKTMRDPLLRIERGKKEQAFLHSKYPAIFRNLPDPRGSPGLGVGVASLPMIMGCKVRFADHMDPIALPALRPDDDPMTLKVPDLDDAMQWLYREIDVLVDHGYPKHSIGLPNIQGPHNIAFRVVGDTRFLGLIGRPSKAAVVHHVLDVVSDTFIEVTKRLRRATGKPEKGPFSMAGCTYYYLSPKQWRTFELPVLEKCKALGDMGLHHCGVATNDMLDNYALWPWTSVEWGFGTDLGYARQRFISSKTGPLPFSCRVSPYRMLNQPASQITADVNWIIEGVQGGPARVAVVGIPWKTPDENIFAMKRAVDAYNRKKAEEEGEPLEQGEDETIFL
nr:uroporphyrinogen decarboxylase family protein [Candidatus Sigynarchaeum springense]